MKGTHSSDGYRQHARPTGTDFVMVGGYIDDNGLSSDGSGGDGVGFGGGDSQDGDGDGYGGGTAFGRWEVDSKEVDSNDDGT